MTSRRIAVPAALVILALAGCWQSATYPPVERTRIDYANHGVYFPIDASAVHRRPDCQWCHGGTATFHAFTCIRCHEHAAGRTDSLHLGIAGYAYDSTGCYGCHADGSIPGVDHAAFFPIGPGTRHAGQRCAECHPTPGDRRVFTCVDCHDHRAEVTDAAHAGIAGYRFTSAACLDCHPRGEVLTREQHAAYFPILTGRHALACDECHSTPGDFRRFECILCHEHTCNRTDPRHREVGGYTCASDGCYRCHPAGRGGD